MKHNLRNGMASGGRVRCPGCHLPINGPAVPKKKPGRERAKLYHPRCPA